MIVERQEFRNRKTTNTVSAAPSMRVPCTLDTLASTRTPVSLITFISTPAGSTFRIRSTAAITFCVTSVVL